MSTSDALRAAGLVGAVSNGSILNGFFNVEDLHRYKASKKPMPSKLTIGTFIKTQNRFDVLSDARPSKTTGLKAGTPGGDARRFDQTGQATRPKPLGKSSAFKEGQKHTSVEDGLGNLEIYATIAQKIPSKDNSADKARKVSTSVEVANGLKSKDDVRKTGEKGTREAPPNLC